MWECVYLSSSLCHALRLLLFSWLNYILCTRSLVSSVVDPSVERATRYVQFTTKRVRGRRMNSYVCVMLVRRPGKQDWCIECVPPRFIPWYGSKHCAVTNRCREAREMRKHPEIVASRCAGVIVGSPSACAPASNAHGQVVVPFRDEWSDSPRT